MITECIDNPDLLARAQDGGGAAAGGDGLENHGGEWGSGVEVKSKVVGYEDSEAEVLVGVRIYILIYVSCRA